MNILITGCAGFIGSHLCEKLLSINHTVVGIDNFDQFYDRKIKEKNLSEFRSHPSFEFQELDFEDANQLKTLEGRNFDLVVHLAAKAGVQPSLQNPEGYIKTNIQGTNNILEFIRSQKIKKLVFASSSSVYGNNKKTPFSELDDVNEPISPYAFTKRSCELMNYSYHQLYNIDILNLRFFTVFGERQRPDLAIHKFVKLIESGAPIAMYGDGSTSRDYTYVQDTVDGIVKSCDYVLKNDKCFEIINLGNNEPITLSRMIDVIYKGLNKKPNVIQESEKPGDVKITYADISKAKRLLNYSPNTPFEEGIKQFITWYRKQNG